jgi:hypothetical protein
MYYTTAPPDCQVRRTGRRTGARTVPHYTMPPPTCQIHASIGTVSFPQEIRFLDGNCACHNGDRPNFLN